ncbi:F0F1 ATP synthase subunit A [Georgenia faecalis]|uniref:ATP synthase subunit a n=1 Tax=Georgenia faecalis TaxID=2483799 RepID=A0ABV9DC38_9MICO|nr:F0F1 ATP synthase subunit A [Georgenia faecalis]
MARLGRARRTALTLGVVLFATLVLAATTRAAEEDSGFHAPSLADFFPAPILFEGTLFEFNRITLVRVIAALVLLALFLLAVRRPRLVPGRAQSVAEMGLEFVRNSIATEVLGKELGRRYTPLLFVMFFGILALNITGIIPFLNIAGTSVIGMPLVFAIVAFVAFVGAGIKAHGAWGYLKTTLFPPGVPWPIYIILAPIEFLSTFILRPATLTIRLLANMVSGHLLLVLCFSATHFLFLQTTGILSGMGALTLAAGFAFTLFEIFIAALQAYIFALLTAVYINLSVESH